MTESIPAKWRRCPSIKPAGPAPTIPTCVRVVGMNGGRGLKIAPYSLSEQQRRNLVQVMSPYDPLVASLADDERVRNPLGRQCLIESFRSLPSKAIVFADP